MLNQIVSVVLQWACIGGYIVLGGFIAMLLKEEKTKAILWIGWLILGLVSIIVYGSIHGHCSGMSRAECQTDYQNSQYEY